MPRSSTRVQCVTYNANLGAGDVQLNEVVHPTLEEGSPDLAGEDPPDLYAIAFQEMLPLHLGLLGLTSGYLNQRQKALNRLLSRHPLGNKKKPAAYTLLAQTIQCGIALFVYALDDTVGRRVKKVETGRATCGIFKLMSNKGAVGVRVTLEADDDLTAGNEEVYAFVSAHLAAHDHGLLRRNADYASIVSRLVFPAGNRLHTIYDSSHVFFMGDLNYRLSLKEPNSIALKTLSHKIHFGLDALTANDTLSHQHEAGRVLHGLREGRITFKPTYKYKAKKGNTYKDFRKRIPGWTDRVFFASWNDADSREGSRRRATVELYRAVQKYCGSDHKPVTAIVSLPAPSRRHEVPNRMRLPTRSPFKPDPYWRPKLIAGAALDRVAGLGLFAIVIVGFGKVKLGILNAILIALGLYAYHVGYFGEHGKLF